MDDTSYIIEATSQAGTHIRTGPLDIGQAIVLTDQHLLPNGWTARYQPLMPLARAMNVFTIARKQHPIMGQDTFVALRRAIITDRENDGADCRRARAAIAHLEAHRPLPMFSGDEECRLAECDHPRAGGLCTELTPAPPLCVACSAAYDPGGEWGPDWIDACQIAWPCQVIRVAAAHYKIPVSFREVNVGG